MPNHPPVALESTVISHGLPYPHNLRLALRLEEIVREAGATCRTLTHRLTDARIASAVYTSSRVFALSQRRRAEKTEL